MKVRTTKDELFNTMQECWGRQFTERESIIVMTTLGQMEAATERKVNSQWRLKHDEMINRKAIKGLNPNA